MIETLKRAYHDIASKVHGDTLAKRQFDALKTVLICSETRGGSTWLMELLGQIPNSTTLWEPLYPGKGVMPEKYNLGWRPNIEEFDEEPEIRGVMEAILAGHLTNRYVLSETTLKKSKRAEQLVIKFTRAHLMLPWLTRQFEFKYKPILLLRHPIAVAQSQVRAFAHKSFEGWRTPQSRKNEIYSIHEPFLMTLKTNLEIQLALWYMHNSIPLSHARNDQDWVVVHYENLLTDPSNELARIKERTGIPIPQISENQLIKRSNSDFKGDFKNAKNQLVKWKSKLTDEELERLQEIITYFKVDIYSCEDHMPRL